MEIKRWLFVALVAVATVQGRPADEPAEEGELSPRTARAHYGSLKQEHRGALEDEDEEQGPLRYYGGASGIWDPATGRREEEPREPSDSVAIQPPPEGSSVAEARPVGLSIAGVGGVAASRPQGMALVGPGGLAISRPVATAVAGVPVGEAILGPAAGVVGGGGGGAGGGSASANRGKIHTRVSSSSPQELAVGPGVVGAGGKYSVIPSSLSRAAQPLLLLPLTYYY